MSKPTRPPVKPPDASVSKAARRPAPAPAVRKPAAPPVYRPQPTPKVLQRKVAAPGPRPAAGPKQAPAAPAVYRPQPTPKVLQRKAAVPSRQPPPPAPPRARVAPPAPARPHTPAAQARPPAQPKMSPGVRPVRAAAPPPASRPATPRAAAVIQRLRLAEANVDIDENDFAAVRGALLASRRNNQNRDYGVLKGVIKNFGGDLANEYGATGSLSNYFASDREEREVIAENFLAAQAGGNLVWQAMATHLSWDGVALRQVFDTASTRYAGLLGGVRIMQADQLRLNANRDMRLIVGAVSLPSAAHRLEYLNDKYSKVAAHPYGYSFCATATMQTDVNDINDYLNLIRDNPGNALNSLITWRWNHQNGQRVEFTVNGRVYSTHVVPGHPQLYPLNGAGVIHGNGPLDMGRTLRGRGLLDETRKIKLYQVYCEQNHIVCNQSAPGQLGKGDKIEYAAAFDALI